MTTATPQATGIPDRSIFGRGSNLQRGLAEFVIQRHLARRAGPHYDIRVGTPWGQLFSWAGKHLPAPGERRMVWQQPLHEGQYADFEGEIGRGYGRGTVKKHDRGKVLVTEATDDKISFVVAHKRFPERFTLIRSPTSPNRGWLMINTTPTKPESAGKLRYAKVPAEDVEKLFDTEYLASEKIDGASALIKLLDDKIEVLSYRTSSGGRPIVHTERLAGGPIRAKIPPELRGKTLRGELYGMRGGKAIPPQELGGLLNATLAETLRRKKERGTDLRVALFDVAGEEDRPYPERLAALRAAARHLPARFFHLPRTAESPEDVRRLWEDVVSGRNPLTSEGIVAHSRKGGKPIKVKQRPEDKVVVRRIFPGTGKYRDMAGGFEYSLTKSGPVVGRVGTGLSDEARRAMREDPQGWIGRVARITSQGRFPSGAHRAPSFLALHEDYDFVPEEGDEEKEQEMGRRAFSVKSILKAAACPGDKIRSGGMGRGEGRGSGKGPVGALRGGDDDDEKERAAIDWGQRLARLAERKGLTVEELNSRVQRQLDQSVADDIRKMGSDRTRFLEHYLRKGLQKQSYGGGGKDFAARGARTKVAGVLDEDEDEPEEHYSWLDHALPMALLSGAGGLIGGTVGAPLGAALHGLPADGTWSAGWKPRQMIPLGSPKKVDTGRGTYTNQAFLETPDYLAPKMGVLGAGYGVAAGTLLYLLHLATRGPKLEDDEEGQQQEKRAASLGAQLGRKLRQLRRYTDIAPGGSEYIPAESMNPLIRRRLLPAVERGDLKPDAMTAWRLSRHMQPDMTGVPLINFRQTPKWYQKALLDFDMGDEPAEVLKLPGREKMLRRLDRFGGRGLDRLARVQDAALALDVPPATQRQELMRVMRETLQTQADLRQQRLARAAQRIRARRADRSLEADRAARRLGHAVAGNAGLSGAALIADTLKRNQE